MIGVDTNVLLRALMDDDPLNSPRAQSFLASRNGGDPAFVNTVVLAELVWSLRVSFKVTKERIGQILRAMLESDAFEFEARNSVFRALHDYESGIGQFTDRLIAEVNHETRNIETATLDKRAARTAPFRTLE
jgi:predicted nucleic-acid-binding protein